MKICRKCLIEKEDVEFSWKIKDNLRQTICKNCQKIYHKTWYALEKNSTQVKNRSLINNKKYQYRNKYFIINLLKTSKCQDCGNNDIRVLEFDHIKNKKFSIARMANEAYSLKLLKAEIAKCEIVCANCHRIRTLTRLYDKGIIVHKLL